MEKVKESLANFVKREYGPEETVDFSDLSRVDFVYGETEDGRQVEVFADLQNLQIVTLLSKEVFDIVHCESLTEMADFIDGSCFDSYIGDVEAVLALTGE